MNAFPRVALISDFWRVNSYGYPSFFSKGVKAQEAWITFLSFFDFKDYDDVKTFWASKSAPRKLHPHAVESWKATFEEFGLLFVESGSNQIHLTAGGIQLREAADAGDQTAFTWIGLNLLLRYPLRGPRRPKSSAHGASDLLLYRFLYSALLDLDQHVWWSELERILCRVFSTSAAYDAIKDVLTLRKDTKLLAKVPLPADRKGAFYNSLNQVVVHAGMNHVLLATDDLACPYGVTEPKRRHSIRPEWASLIRSAIDGGAVRTQCESSGVASNRLPIAPTFKNEAAYFDYMGAKVTPQVELIAPAVPAITLQGEQVLILSTPKHYRVAGDHIEGRVAVLCQLARGQRLILGHDEQRTYLVEEKKLIDSTTVRVQVRRARPISDISIIRSIQDEPDGSD